ncbi:MAG: C40 family peptidase [Candidatus Sabulitectum sp.]|nr:C40 family peptidase [Candidatus Sabulitectum sp.]
MKYLIFLVLASCFLAQEEDSIHIAGSDSLSLAEKIIAQAVSYLEVPYVYGGVDESGFDCSGLAYRVFNDNGVSLPRTVTAMGELGIFVSRDSLQPGDLLIFHDPTHTGIYIGDGEFIHCSSYLDRGVVITAITQSNYARRYYTARRVLTD